MNEIVMPTAASLPPTGAVFELPPGIEGAQVPDGGFVPGQVYGFHNGEQWAVGPTGAWAQVVAAEQEPTWEDPSGGDPDWVPTEPGEPSETLPVLKDDYSFTTYMKAAAALGRSFRFNDFRQEVEMFDPTGKTRKWEMLEEATALKTMHSVNGRFVKEASQAEKAKGTDTKPCRFRQPDVKGIMASLPAYPSIGYDPVRDRFSAPLPADRPEREIALLDGFLLRFGAPDDALSRHAARAMFGSVAQRALATGPNIVKQIIMLSGVRDIGKSAIVREMLPPELEDYFLEKVDFSQDIEKMARALRRFLLAEVPEANGLNRAESSKVKAFVSMKTLPVRMLFASNTKPAPNRTAMVATVNPNAKAIAVDDDAVTFRFPIVHLKHRCEGDLAELMAAIRDDLYIAARWLLQTGELSLDRVPSELDASVREAARSHKATSESVLALFERIEDIWHERRDGQAPPGITNRTGWLDIAVRGATTGEMAQFAQAHDMAFALQGQGMDKIVAALRDDPDWDLRRNDDGRVMRQRTDEGLRSTWVHLPSARLHDEERRDGKPEAPWVAVKRKAQTAAAADARRVEPQDNNVVQMHAPVPAPPAYLGGPVMPTASSVPPEGDVT